jgi:hypothetical protein
MTLPFQAGDRVTRASRMPGSGWRLEHGWVLCDDGEDGVWVALDGGTLCLCGRAVLLKVQGIEQVKQAARTAKAQGLSWVEP